MTAEKVTKLNSLVRLVTPSPIFERYFFLLLSLSADGKLDPAFPVMRSVLSNALMRVEWR